MELELELQNPFTSHEDQQYGGITSLFANESDHMPCLRSNQSSDLRFAIRQNAASRILQAKSSYDLDPFLVYLSVNYIDRFLSKQEILEQRPWITRIMIVASLSLAAKMRNSDLSTLLSTFQTEEGFEFDSQTVHRMETVFLANLQWRMRSITPFSFQQYFLSLLEIKDNSVTQAMKHRASDIILNVQHVVKLLEYRPSTLAAAALLCAIQDLAPTTFCSSKATFCSCEYVNQEKLLECLGVMQEILREGFERTGDAAASGAWTPVSVLDQQGTSSRSEDVTSSSEFPERDHVKRRRLNGFCDNRTLQIS